MGREVAKEKSVKNERDRERRSTEERAPIDMSFAQGVAGFLIVNCRGISFWVLFFFFFLFSPPLIFSCLSLRYPEFGVRSRA